jgi:hypothetical protein
MPAAADDHAKNRDAAGQAVHALMNASLNPSFHDVDLIPKLFTCTTV